MDLWVNRPELAGAVEATASTGGQIMPPIMGAGAFIMAELLSIPYVAVIKAALIPAVLYFLSVLFGIHFEAKRIKLGKPPKELISSLNVVSLFSFLVPLAVLIIMLVFNYIPMYAAFWAVVSSAIFYLCLIKPGLFTDIIGIGLAVVVILLQIVGIRRAAREQKTASQ